MVIGCGWVWLDGGVIGLDWVGGVGEAGSGWGWVWGEGSKHPGAAVPGVIQRGQEPKFEPRLGKLLSLLERIDPGAAGGR